MIDAYASQPNYWRHLAPIVGELERRGHDVRSWASRLTRPWGPRGRPVDPSLVLCASWVDARRFETARVVYVEHGAGQTYTGVTGEGYAGADALEHVVLFLAPSEHVADRWRARYPQAAVEAVGCPALDRHLKERAGQGEVDSDARDSAAGVTMSEVQPLVAITSHWRCGVCPETMPALDHFRAALPVLARVSDWKIVGHSHPRAHRMTAQLWAAHDISWESDPDVVLASASLLVADNTSLLYEAAAVGLPVLVLNAPWYRRSVEHGLRFWSHVPGIQCDSPATLLPAIAAALDDPPESQALRARAADYAYARTDGSSTARAVDAIEGVLG